MPPADRLVVLDNSFPVAFWNGAAGSSRGGPSAAREFSGIPPREILLIDTEGVIVACR
jgi:hypothetical protein